MSAVESQGRLGDNQIMRRSLAVLWCLLSSPAFAVPDVNSANFIVPHCRAAQQLGKPPGFMAGLCAGIVDALVGGVICAAGENAVLSAAEQHECTTAARGRALRGEAPRTA
jgi:hypothetical protein